MESVREIVKAIMFYNNWNKIDLARYYKVAPSQVTRWLAGVQRPRGDIYLDMYMSYQKMKNTEARKVPV